MNTIHVTRVNEGEHWLVVTDVTTIKASAGTPQAKCLSWR